jgi:hypothetical protein
MGHLQGVKFRLKGVELGVYGAETCWVWIARCRV